MFFLPQILNALSFLICIFHPLDFVRTGLVLYVASTCIIIFSSVFVYVSSSGR